MMTNQTANTPLRTEVRRLAEAAFSQNLISGYGDGPYADEFQLYLAGKPRHLGLEAARSLLQKLLKQSSDGVGRSTRWTASAR